MNKQTIDTNTMRNYFIISILLLLLVKTVQGQELRFEQLNVEHGLSNVTVQSIYQDECNRMWIATHDGLNCYDGNKVRSFRHYQQDKQIINTLHISCITGDRAGHLYLCSPSAVIEFNLHTEKMRTILDNPAPTICGTAQELIIAQNNKLLIYSTTKGEFTATYTLPFPNLTISSIIEASDSTLWLASTTHGLFSFSRKQNATRRYLENTQGRQVMQDRKGNIWYTTTNEGVYCYNPKKQQTEQHYLANAANASSIVSNFIRTITEDAEGNIWVGSRHGLSCIHPVTRLVTQHLPSSYPHSLSSISVNTLYTDTQGTIWIGTYFGGINYLNPQRQAYRYIIPGKKNGLTYPSIGSFCEDSQGDIWIGTEGGGVFSYSPAEKSFKRYDTDNSAIASNYIKKVLFDKQRQAVWIASDYSDELCCLDIKAKKISRHQLPLLPDGSVPALYTLASDNDTLYIGTNQGIVAYDKVSGKSRFIHQEKNLFSNILNDLMIDSHRRLWFSSLKCPVSYSLVSRKFTRYSYNISYSEQESKEIPAIFFEDHNQQIWLGTNGYGVLQLQEDKRSFESVAALGSLNNSSVAAVLQSIDNQYLIASNQGLTILSPDKKSFTQLRYTEEFPIRAINKRGLFVASSGDIYIGGVPGMAIYQEKDLKNIHPSEQITLTTLYINNKEVTPDDESNILKKALPYTSSITLNHNQHIFSITYSTDNYLNPNDNNIEYRLLGYSPAWVTASLGRNITYTSLPYGSYTFEIRPISNPEKIVKLGVIIKPPFYFTYWAYTFYLLIILGLICYFFKEYRERLYLQTSLAFREREKVQTEQMNQSKIRFFINISHEIRTPVTLALAQAELLLSSPQLHSSTRSRITAMHRSLLNLKHLITQLLDFRKQEQGELRLKVCEVDIVALLNESYHLFKGLAQTRNINFTLNTPSEKIALWVDPDQLPKIINNLTVNAFKFVKDGGEILISIEEEEEQILIHIKDNGIGIPAADVEHIFDRFYQATNSVHSGGSGIGLALSQGIAEAHGGHISVKSTEDEGSVFTVKLRKGNAHFNSNVFIIPTVEEIPKSNYISYAEETKETVTLDTENKSKLNVMVVEDNAELRELIREMLLPLYNVTVAADGTEAWEQILCVEPDLVVTDVMMPRMSGTELCAKIKNNVNCCHLPVLLLTARQGAEYEIEGLRLGADAYLTKPFDVKKFITLCHNLINSRQLIQNKYKQQQEPEQEQVATSLFDQEFIDKLMLVINAHLEDDSFDIDAMAREMGMGRTKLFSRLKQSAGTTPNNMLQNMRLKRAAFFLLNHPEMNISDIAYKLCFNSPRYFNKCFKDMFGVAPANYKKKDTE